MSSGRRRGRPKRKAQRRAKWQAEQRFSKRTKRQTPRRGFDALTGEIIEQILETPLLIGVNVPDGHPLSPYARRKEA